MRADNDGEGGIMALPGLAAHSEADPRWRTALLMVGIAGAALFHGDGMITPAISVLAAAGLVQVAHDPGVPVAPDADMGHFGRAPIQLGWLSAVLPALALNHFGQEALVLAHPDAVDMPFFRLFPG